MLQEDTIFVDHNVEPNRAPGLLLSLLLQVCFDTIYCISSYELYVSDEFRLYLRYQSAIGTNSFQYETFKL
jgi:hypothetical protein